MSFGRGRLLAQAAVLMVPAFGLAQYRQEPGHSLGTVTTQGNLIVLTLDEGVLGKDHLFNLAHRTIRFTPDGVRYRAENVAEQWDADFGPELHGNEATLTKFAFPFSGKSWSSISVGMTGSMTFSEAPLAPEGGRRGGGIEIERFAELSQAAAGLINTVPAISVFFKPRMSGTRYVKELADRVVLTWSLTEPVGGVQDMTWTPTVNKFQAVLWKDGRINLTYDEVHAQDAIVGIYPMVAGGFEKEIGSVAGEDKSGIAPNLDVMKVKLSAVDGLLLKATLETKGPVPAANDPAAMGVTYRVCLDKKKPTGDCAVGGQSDAVWTVQAGGGRGGRREGATPRYVASGMGIAPGVKIDGNTISLQGTLPAGYKSGDTVYVSAGVQTAGKTVDQVAAHEVKLVGLGSPAVDLATVKKGDGPFAVAYESFHYMRPPRANDLTCSVIKALGDKYDMLAYYSDFRIDNPEAGTSSTGPLGGGPAGGEVTGIGAKQRNLASYCSQGRFQWQFIQPVYVGANQMQEYPPDGLKEADTHNLVSYSHQLEERTSNGKIPPYDYAMSQIGHEMGHRWSAFVSAKVNGETIQLGPTHWAKGLQAPVAFPYQRPTEASAMGGGVWQDNFDGTFTQLDDDYYVPATGWSYLDLYLMGMISPAEVPEFFILRNMVAAGKDANDHAIYKADRTKVTVQDVIAVEGPRLPAVDAAQKGFNTGMVVVVEHGKMPSPLLVERVNGIRERWMDYWTTTTGYRSTMTADPK
ncbi:CheW domain-containing protein [Granulicella tundricola]|uniref:Uncharacterized protein n=1 Tax=Granulicella tundricola (strain ATCC BAA-1859 / DSM 23138 / MP5ACTX9) TaxID=1198114 RepID=E8X6D0_GRATM|nr:hypothetical protein [Granulicella tundricola]ADW71014.1 hypothetical protein AciX9_4238 [Granulicella tundricola MP5ACTX9]